MPTTLTRSFQSAEELIARTQDLPSLPAVVMQCTRWWTTRMCMRSSGAEISKDQASHARIAYR